MSDNVFRFVLRFIVIFGVLLMMISNANAKSINCKKHPIFCQITKNKPSINKKYAMKLSNVIYKMHRKYHIPSRIFTAILMQESGYSLEAKGCHSGLAVDDFKLKTCLDLALKKKTVYSQCAMSVDVVETKVCTDFGITQIYYKTAKRWKFNINKLTENLEYSVEAGAIVLHDIMERFEAEDVNYWVRYNCGFRGTTKRDTCQIYKKLVERYL
jgi:hypothetical protein